MFGAISKFITSGPEIASIQTASGWTTIVDVRTSPLYVPLASGAYQLALDHPAIPYRASASTLPYIIVALGQSNLFIQRSYAWAPNSRAKVWNRGRANDTEVGTAYAAINPALMSVAEYRAHLIVEANPDRDVRLIVFAAGSLDIGHFDDGNALFWDTGTSAANPGTGKIRGNNANLALVTKLYASLYDSAASNIFSAYNLIQSGHPIQLRDNSTPATAWFYTATGPIVNNGTWVEIPVAYVSGSGTLSDGIRFINQPDYQSAMDLAIPAALADAGVTKIDEVMWWQHESNTQYGTEARFKAQFESVVDKIQAETWADDDVKFIMFSGSDTALTGQAHSDKGPEWISELAAVDPVNRKYVDLTDIPVAQWQDANNIHMTAEGYISAGQKSFDAYAPEINDGTYFLLGAGRTYRYNVKNNDFTLANTYMTPVSHLRDNNNTGVQYDYDHRVWPGFALYATGSDLYSIAHHEWYPYTVTTDGIPGRNATLGHKWVTAPLWVKNTNNGNMDAWETIPYTTGPKNDDRLFLTPEEWFLQQYDTLYGYQHPGGIVYPPDIGQTNDPYYYAVLDTNHLVGPGATDLTVGVTMIRWSDLEDPTTTEFLVNGVWTDRDMASYQGNNAPAAQQPDVWFPLSGLNPYAGGARTDGMGKCLKWHNPTQQWLMFGFDGRKVPSVCFTRSKTLSDPKFEQNGVQYLTYTGGGVNADYGGNSYWTVFDPASTDQNFVDIGNSPILLRTNDYVTVEKQTLQINVTG